MYNCSFRFWELAFKTASVTSQRHMIERFTEYLEGVVEEARDRDTDTHRSIASYLEKRRRTVGALPSFVPNELDLDIPDEVYHHPDIDEMSALATDLVIFANVSCLALYFFVSLIQNCGQGYDVIQKGTRIW